MLVMGDFNLPDVHMFSNSTGLQFFGKHSESADIVFDCFTLNEFNQCNSFLNTSGSLLDLVFSNMANTFVSLCKNDLLISADIYHPPLCINFEFASDNLFSNPMDLSSLDFKKANYPKIISEFSKINWNVLYECNNIEIAINVFYKIVLDLINVYVPNKTPLYSKFSLWFSPELKSLLHRKRIAHRVFKQSNDKNDYVIFSNIRLECKKLSKKCYSEHLLRTQNQLLSNPRYFWKFVKELKNNNNLPM